MTSKTWTIDPTHSGIHFSVRHMVFAKVRGRFGAFSGTLQLDQKDLTKSKVEAEIDAESIDTGVADRDKHLRSADFLDVERFPKLLFKSKHLEKEGEGYRVIGDLTIADVTREVVLTTDYAGQAQDPWGNQRVAFTAKTSFNRAEFGLKWNQALEAGGVLVGDKIEIEIEVQAVQAAT